MVDVLNWHVEAHPDRPHIHLYSDEGDGEVLTYRQLGEGAQAIAAGLQDKGLMPGDTVSIMLPTGQEYFFTFLGILLAGGIPVPIYPPFRMNQLEDHLRRHSTILRNCGAKMMVIIPEAKRFALVLNVAWCAQRNLRRLLLDVVLYCSPDCLVIGYVAAGV